MGYSNYWANTAGMGLFTGVLGFFLIPVMVWSLAWKGWALWKAAKNDSVAWFIVLLLVNTLGILDILYVFVFANKNEKSVKVVKALPKKSRRK